MCFFEILKRKPVSVIVSLITVIAGIYFILRPIVYFYNMPAFSFDSITILYILLLLTGVFCLLAASLLIYIEIISSIDMDEKKSVDDFEETAENEKTKGNDIFSDAFR